MYFYYFAFLIALCIDLSSVYVIYCTSGASNLLDLGQVSSETPFCHTFAPVKVSRTKTQLFN